MQTSPPRWSTPETMAKPRISVSDVHAFLAAQVGPVSGLEMLAEGEESQAFRFDADGPFVLRINREPAGFTKDQLAFHRFGRVLPVPEVTLMAPLGDAFACVSRRIEGVTLQDLSFVEAGQLAPALARTMDVMASADMAEFTGAGPFDADGRGGFASWGDWIGNLATWNWSGVPGIGPALDRVLDFARTCPEHRGLVHGDFGSNNVLCAAGRITGVIDWSEAMAGDPCYDLANILFWRSWLPCMEAQARYFEDEEPARLLPADSLPAYQLHIGLVTLWHAVRDGDHDLEAWTRTRLNQLI